MEQPERLPSAGRSRADGIATGWDAMMAEAGACCRSVSGHQDGEALSATSRCLVSSSASPCRRFIEITAILSERMKSCLVEVPTSDLNRQAVVCQS